MDCIEYWHGLNWTPGNRLQILPDRMPRRSATATAGALKPRVQEGACGAAPNGDSQGAEFGVMHSF
jgi:hypothetical protein